MPIENLVDGFIGCFSIADSCDVIILKHYPENSGFEFLSTQIAQPACDKGEHYQNKFIEILFHTSQYLNKRTNLG